MWKKFFDGHSHAKEFKNCLVGAAKASGSNEFNYAVFSALQKCSIWKTVHISVLFFNKK